MPRLPPADKLPLALRKNIRDEWDAKKPDFEKKLTELLGVAWTIDIDPKAIWPYATEGWAKDSTGSCLASYVGSGIRRLDEFVDKYGDDGKAELNTICSAHVLTMDFDEAKKVSYCGCDVHEGKLRILFAEGRLGTNDSEALSQDNMLKALNAAPPPEGSTAPLSYAARTGIRQDYDPKIEAVRAKIGEILGNADIKLVPDFESSFAKLAEEAKKKKSPLREDWQSVLGSYTLSYFEGLYSQLQWQKFEDDDLLKEGFGDEISKGEIAFRMVDKLKEGSYYNECAVEGGVLYLQTIPEKWGTNVTDTAQKLLDLM